MISSLTDARSRWSFSRRRTPPGLEQLADQRGGGRKRHREALLAGGQAQCEGNVRFAGAAVAQSDDVLAAQYVLAAGQFEDEHLV